MLKIFTVLKCIDSAENIKNIENIDFLMEEFIVGSDFNINEMLIAGNEIERIINELERDSEDLQSNTGSSNKRWKESLNNYDLENQKNLKFKPQLLIHGTSTQSKIDEFFKNQENQNHTTMIESNYLNFSEKTAFSNTEQEMMHCFPSDDNYLLDVTSEQLESNIQPELDLLGMETDDLINIYLSKNSLIETDKYNFRGDFVRKCLFDQGNKKNPEDDNIIIKKINEKRNESQIPYYKQVKSSESFSNISLTEPDAQKEKIEEKDHFIVGNSVKTILNDDQFNKSGEVSVINDFLEFYSSKGISNNSTGNIFKSFYNQKTGQIKRKIQNLEFNNTFRKRNNKKFNFNAFSFHFIDMIDEELDEIDKKYIVKMNLNIYDVILKQFEYISNNKFFNVVLPEFIVFDSIKNGNYFTLTSNIDLMDLLKFKIALKSYMFFFYEVKNMTANFENREPLIQFLLTLKPFLREKIIKYTEPIWDFQLFKLYKFIDSIQKRSRSRLKKVHFQRLDNILKNQKYDIHFQDQNFSELLFRLFFNIDAKTFKFEYKKISLELSNIHKKDKGKTNCIAIKEVVKRCPCFFAYFLFKNKGKNILIDLIQNANRYKSISTAFKKTIKIYLKKLNEEKENLFKKYGIKMEKEIYKFLSDAHSSVHISHLYVKYDLNIAGKSKKRYIRKTIPGIIRSFCINLEDECIIKLARIE